MTKRRPNRKFLKVDPLENGTMDLRVKSSGKLLGCFMIDADGYFLFWPLKEIGGLSSYALTEIAEILDELNSEHDNEIKSYFDYEGKYHSPQLDRILKEMKGDPPFLRFKRWTNLQIWLLTCNTRKFWDRSYTGYIFKKRKTKENK